MEMLEFVSNPYFILYVRIRLSRFTNVFYLFNILFMIQSSFEQFWALFTSSDSLRVATRWRSLTTAHYRRFYYSK